MTIPLCKCVSRRGSLASSCSARATASRTNGGFDRTGRQAHTERADPTTNEHQFTRMIGAAYSRVHLYSVPAKLDIHIHSWLENDNWRCSFRSSSIFNTATE